MIHLTEKFLWDIYKLTKITDEMLDAIIPRHAHHKSRAFLEVFWPDYYDIKDHYWQKYKEKKKRERFKKLISYLKIKGYLNLKDLKNKKAVMITPKGLEKILHLKINSGKMKQRADKKWQMVLFDIPEQRRNDRDSFRNQLKYLGYKKLQKSIWVCPYDVLRLTQQLIKNYKLDRFVRLLLVEEIKI